MSGDQQMTKILNYEEENKLAELYGWSCVPDKKRGPEGWCSFKKYGERIWQSSSLKWVRAEFDGITYSNHRYYNTLEEAILQADSINSRRCSFCGGEGVVVMFASSIKEPSDHRNALICDTCISAALKVMGSRFTTTSATQKVTLTLHHHEVGEHGSHVVYTETNA